MWIAVKNTVLYVFFWVFPRRPIVVCRRFGTLYQFHLQRLDVHLHPALEDGTDRGFRNVGKPQSDAGEIPKRIHTIYNLSWLDSPMGLNLNVRVARSHSDTPHSVGLLWTSDRLVTETSILNHTTLTTDRHPCSRRDSNLQSQQASGRRPTP